MKITVGSSNFREELIKQVDAAGDAARLAVVGDAARIKEYERAQQHAESYRDAGYAGDVPSSVASWAQAKGWTAWQAADDILAAATRWYAALDAIRAARLMAKENIRNARTGPEAEAILTGFKEQLQALLQPLLGG